MLQKLKTVFKKLLNNKKVPVVTLGVAALLILTAGLFTPMTQPTTASKKKLPIYCVDTQGKKQVSISFDAAWGAEDTDTLLEILKKNDVKATFFLCGYWVDKYPEEVKKIYNDGHDVDRMIMLLRNEENIREVIPFPMSGTAQDLMCGAPNEVTEQQLREVHIKVRD